MVYTNKLRMGVFFLPIIIPLSGIVASATADVEKMVLLLMLVLAPLLVPHVVP